ncbi:MAG: helix-turn-helix domain-containing protein [Chloroflexi bacterium]|nr:helix-turn-helix domain-containing protein [Chloroflexota bacterium]
MSQRIQDRGWSVREFGRQVGVSHTHAARIVNGKVAPSGKLCRDIAAVLDVPVHIVMEYAGLLPARAEEDPSLAEAQHLFAQLSDDEQEMFLAQLRAVVDLKKRSEREKNAP